jgi:hypothetical protein
MNNHTKISFLKSGVRLFGFLFIASQHFISAAIILIAAELISVMEELVV